MQGLAGPLVPFVTPLLTITCWLVTGLKQTSRGHPVWSPPMDVASTDVLTSCLSRWALGRPLTSILGSPVLTLKNQPPPCLPPSPSYVRDTEARQERVLGCLGGFCGFFFSFGFLLKSKIMSRKLEVCMWFDRLRRGSGRTEVLNKCLGSRGSLNCLGL